MTRELQRLEGVNATESMSKGKGSETSESEKERGPQLDISTEYNVDSADLLLTPIGGGTISL